MTFVRHISIFFAAALIGTTGCNDEATVTARHRGELRASGGAASDAVAYDAHILIDQFGYRPLDAKVAVIRSPHVGFDASNAFFPGGTYQLRRAGDGVVLYSGTTTAWNGGATDSTSGDAGWWFDFSSASTPGAYFIYDVTRNVRSPVFSIDQLVYQKILKAAVRMYYYQRAGIAKTMPYAERCWVDGAAYLGPNQDTQARDITDPNNAAKVKDLRGGWFDAGDTNKYVTNAITPVHQLLAAYQDNPSVFTDDFNIPESGNGVPDILDEVKWETDWLKKMQYPDGSVALKVGDTAYAKTSPPSADRSPRYYVPSCTSSTIAAAGMFAHASYVYGGIPVLASEAATLKTDAINAWNNYQRSPTKQTSCDSGAVKVGGADLSAAVQNAEAVVAAIYLYAITGDSTYGTYAKSNYTLLRPYHDVGWIRYSSEQGEALLFYTTLVNAEPTFKAMILANKLSDTLGANNVYGFSASADLYRNFLHDYVWGSNQVRSNYGNSNTEVSAYHIAVPSTTQYQTRALDTLHYLHGVNPFGMVFLSNMYEYGATSAVEELFSSMNWNAACGAAPGYVTGGPNLSAGVAGVPASEAPPTGQPAQKSYKDWKGLDGSWTVNEPDNAYQGAYVQLLTAFAK